MPPTIDEVEAAAARLREIAAATTPGDIWHHYPFEDIFAMRHAAQVLLADAWLANHAADDSTHLTPEWLAAAAGGQQPDAVSEWRVAPTSRLCVCRGGRAGGAWVCWLTDSRGDTVTLPDLATRGQFRRLLAALGVPAGE